MSAERTRDAWIVFGLALAVRLAYLALNARTNPSFDYLVMDSLQIDAWARAIAAGDPGSAVYFRGPLVPYLYALVYWLGGGLRSALFVNQLAGAATCALVYLLARAHFARGVAWLAAGVAAFYWPSVYFEGELLSEPVYITLVMLALWLLERAATRPEVARLASAGACLGLAALARPTVLALLPALPLWFALQPREAGAAAPSRAWLRASCGVAAACGLVLLPAVIHNFRADRSVVPVVWSGGLNFYIGNNPLSDGRSAVIPALGAPWDGGEQAALELASSQAGEPLNAAQASRFYMRLGLDYVTSQPASAARLFARKLAMFWEGPERSNEKYIYFFWEHFGFGRLPLPGFWLISPLALAGMICLWPRRRELALLYLFVLTQMLGVAAFFVCARYRLPAVPVLIVFAAWTGAELWSRLRSRRGSAAIALLALVAVLFVGVNASYPTFLIARDANLVTSHHTLARALIERGDREGAELELTRALAAYSRTATPYHARVAQDVYLDLGTLLHARGACAQAVEVLGRIRPEHPRVPEARLMFAECSEQTAHSDDAIRAYRSVLATDPTNPRARVGLARSLEAARRQGSPEAARAPRAP